MFDHFAWSVLVTPALVLVGTWLLADRLRPDVALRVFVGAAGVAAAAGTVNVVAFGVKALAEVPAIARVGGWSHEIVVADTAHVPWVSWLSFAWSFVIVAGVAAAWVRRRSALRAIRSEVDWLEPHGDVVTVDDERVDAFALPGESGRSGRIVVTTGILDVLDERQTAAVIAHERAHLDGDHAWLLWVSRLAAIAHPVLWPVARKMAYVAERAADEAAADELGGDRRDVAKAIAVAALAASHLGSGRRAQYALAALGDAPGVVPLRVTALMAPGARRRWPGLVPMLIAAGTVFWTGECVYDLYELLVLATVR
ncbi:M48 family metalloprotease [Lentzea sp. NPDC058436]|uniref:M48 family metalloprotease n=1 Tax=Lentzea sp. NPDC058436 TaxID=3346499 RepID=UPI0036658520